MEFQPLSGAPPPAFAAGPVNSRAPQVAAPALNVPPSSTYGREMVERRFSRNVQSLEAIFDFVTEFAARQGLTEDERYEVDLILEELFTNLVKYSTQRLEDIGIGLDCRDSQLTLVLRDFDAEEFDVTRTRQDENGADLARPLPGGRGLALVRKYADEFRYDYRDRNSTITVTKRLDR